MLKKLIKSLRKDKELFFSWQSSIAMGFIDEYYRNKKKHKNKNDIHFIANNAAKNFLNMLIKE